MDEIDILNNMLTSNTGEGRQGIISFARYIRGVRLDNSTLPVFIKFIRTGVTEALDELYRERDPISFFSNITPNKGLISSVLKILTENSPNKGDSRVVLSCLGILLSAYYNPQEGMSLCPMTVQELFHTAKYFVTDDTEVAELLEELLDALKTLPATHYRELQLTAVKISDAHFDKSKKLSNVIPGNILAEH